ncbi:hypothetical protein QTP86_030125, partial [Hemibagrus guttatus]
MFASQATSEAQRGINTYTSSVLDHINMCIDNVTTVKHVKHFPIQKPWMNSEVHLLLKARDTAFKSGDAEDYSRANLKRGIKKAKHAHKLHIEEHFHSNSDPRHMWKRIQTITDHKPSIQSLPTSNAFLPDKLNYFFARFDKAVIHHTRNADSSKVVHPISLYTTEHNSNIFIKYVDDTTVVGRISNNDESAYREEIQSLSAWCSMNNLNATKTEELIVDFRKSSSSRHSPIYIN